MPPQYQPLLHPIHLSAIEDNAGPAVAVPATLSVEFRFSPEKPQVGQPGKDPGELIAITRADGGTDVVVSLGKHEKFTAEMARRAGGGLGKWLGKSGAASIDLDLDRLPLNDGDGQIAQALCEGIRLGGYEFKRYKKQEEEPVEIVVRLFGNNRLVADKVEALTEAVLFARDLSHEPANIINPASLASIAQKTAAKYGLGYRLIDEEELKALGAGAILAVGSGSKTPPCLIILEYAGNGASEKDNPVVLAGKAITFDSGGYSIKDSSSIVGMKYDKCGGVTVLAAMQAAAELKIKTPLVGIIGAAENMISGEAYRPDDILTAMSGKTVEIISTDAEGRLVLADTLTYAQRYYHPRALIDLATLTGGVVVALGHVRAGLLSNDDSLSMDLSAAGDATFERIWRLPLDEDFSKNILGDDADIKNSGGREGHCILGGAFLKEFIEPGVAWAHLDIAGMATTAKDLPYAPKGATGFGVRLLINYLENLA
ncbi:MAG: leucyl aminopeptidase [Anaerolineaceae bacterium]|nr:leucyl aminopeptidase [Anaerolineaceae bacterium]